MRSPYLDSPNRKNLKTLSNIFLALFLLIALALSYWGVVRAAAILDRTDNPRLIEEELRIRRGSIMDRNNQLLAYNEGPIDEQQRIYPYSNFGPVIGFYNLNFGTSGSEAGFDPILRNDPISAWQSIWQDALHLPQEGNDIKLALDARIQAIAVAALDNHQGAALLLELDEDSSQRAWVRALVSSPTFDPNILEEQFESLGSNDTAPLLNRAMQGQYQPGMLLQPFILAYAIDQGIIQLNDIVENPDRLVSVNGQQIGCQTPPPANPTWADVLRNQCPGPMIDLADQLGNAGLDSAFTNFGLNVDPNLEIDTATVPDEPTNDPLLAGIGQDTLSVTPYQIGLAFAALANNGLIPQGQIGVEVQNADGSWQPWRLEANTMKASSASAANDVLDSLPKDENLFERDTLVPSGPESKNAWYTAILDGQQSDLIVVLILEGEEDQTLVQRIGRSIISAGDKALP